MLKKSLKEIKKSKIKNYLSRLPSINSSTIFLASVSENRCSGCFIVYAEIEVSSTKNTPN